MFFIYVAKIIALMTGPIVQLSLQNFHLARFVSRIIKNSTVVDLHFLFSSQNPTNVMPGWILRSKRPLDHCAIFESLQSFCRLFIHETRFKIYLIGTSLMINIFSWTTWMIAVIRNCSSQNDKPYDQRNIEAAYHLLVDGFFCWSTP